MDFAALHRIGDPLILPNVWDVASARSMVKAGFPALGTTSLGVAAANGLPDGVGATDGVFVPGLSKPADIAAVVAAVDVPVNVLFLPGRQTVATLTDFGVRRISTGSLLFRTALAASVEAALAVRDGFAVRADLPSYTQVNAGSPAHWRQRH